MENITLFFSNILGAVASFLASEPIIYFVALVMLLFVIRAVKDILS